MTEINKKNVFSNFIWRFLERFGAEIVTLIVSIVLARVLDPVVYGTVALIMVFTTILQVFVDSGLGSALVQKKDADDLDFSTVFYFNVIVCAVMYLILFFTAPLIAKFYNNTELVPLIRVLGIIIIISGVKNIQHAFVSRNLLFKKFFFATLVGTIIAAVVGIVFAYKGYGAWAIIAQYLVNAFIDTVILWITVKWRPKWCFSFSRLKVLFKFGWKILASQLLGTVYSELSALIIGKKYTKEDLAFYNKGGQFPKTGATLVNASIDSVLLPVMAREQDNKDRVKAITRRSIKTSSFILWPLMIGLAVCAKPFVSLVLTDKWLPAVPFLQIACIVYAFHPIHTANLNAIKAMGRSDYFLILEVIKKIIGISAILITMWFGVIWIAIGTLGVSVCSQIVNSWPNKKLLGYSYLDQLKDISASLILAVVMGAIVYCINFIGLPNWASLLVQIPLGAVIYVGGAWLLKFETLRYCIDLVKQLFKKAKNNKEVSEKQDGKD